MIFKKKCKHDWMFLGPMWIKENPNFLMGQWERYKNLFEKISLEKFKEMIK